MKHKMTNIIRASETTMLQNSLSFVANVRQNAMLFGVGLAVLSNVLFGVIYLYSHWLSPLSGTQVFLWRMLAMWFGLFALMLMSNGFVKLKTLLKDYSIKQWLLLLLPTPILASQLWLFMWAPVNGQAVNTAMGYFLFPLVMVLVGCFFFKEKLNKLQKIAVTLAGVGVLLQLWLAGSVSWATLWVCLTYPIYYAIRRWQNFPALFGLFVDLTVITPVALLAIIWQQSSVSVVMGSGVMIALIIGLGIISALSMQSNLQASNLLPVNVFGMLSYLEPALLFILSIFVLNEVVKLEMLLSFALIWAGVVVMIINAILASKTAKQNHNPSNGH